MRLPTIALVAAILLPSAAPAEEDATAHHRRVYAEVNRNLASYARTTASVELADAPVPVEVSAWREGDRLRKMVLRYPDDHGQSLQEFYYDDDGLVFVYAAVTTRAIDGGKAVTREQRHYFAAGRMIRWLDDAKRPVPPDSAAFRDREREVLADAGRFAAPPAPAPVRQTEGVFAGLEEGDYTHLLLTVGGETLSFFILATDRSLERLLERPDAYVGKPIGVLWRRSVETIPEAGGATEIDTAVSVRLPR